MQTELKKTIIDLNKWLGEVSQATEELQRSMMKSSSEAESTTKVYVDGLAHTAARIRSLISDQKQALSILQRTPPGIQSAVIDFLYNVVVDPSAQTEESKYLEKLKSLDSRVNKDFDSVPEALGIPAFRVEQAVTEAIDTGIKPLLPRDESENIIDSSPIKGLYSAVQPVAEYMLTPRLVKSRLDDLRVALDKYLDVDVQHRDKILGDLLTILQNKLEQHVAEDKRTELLRGFENINKLLSQQSGSQEGRKSTSLNKPEASSFQNIITAQAQNLEQLVDYTRQQLLRFGGDQDGTQFGQQFIKEIDQFASTLKEKASAKDLDTVQRYSNYVKELLGQQGGKLYSLFISIMKNLNELEVLLGKESQQQQSQSEEPNTPEENIVGPSTNPEESSTNQSEIQASDIETRKKKIYNQLAKLKEKF